MKNCAAIVLLAGTSSRFNHEKPKQFHKLGSEDLFLHPLRTMVNSNLFEDIIAVCHPQWLSYVMQRVPRGVRVIVGGPTRQESAYQGLFVLDQSIKWVCIHDAARPFVTEEMLARNLELSMQKRAVDTVTEATDTIVHAPGGSEVSSIPNRSEYYSGQTPQTFEKELIRRAHERALEEGFFGTDDCGLVKRIGEPVHLYKSDAVNPKITNFYDLLAARAYLPYHESQKREPLKKPLTLRDKKFLISGGNGEIAQAILKKLEAKGAKGVLISRKGPYKLTKIDDTSIHKLLDSVEKKEGKFDGIINCIGYLKADTLDKLSAEEIDLTLKVNLDAVVYLCKHAPLNRHAHILNVGSTAAKSGRSRFSIYSAAKAGVHNFTQALAQEKPQHYVNCLAPTKTDTKMRRSNFKDEPTTELLTTDQVASKAIETLQSNATGEIIWVE